MSTDAPVDTTHQIFNDLNKIERALCSAHFGKNLEHDTPFTALRERFSRLSRLVSIQQALQRTAREIRKHDASVFGRDLQPKINKFLDVAFGEGNPRLETIRQLDPEGFLFLALSYPPQDLLDMDGMGFRQLIKIAPEILRLQELPQCWIFAEGIQLALASRAEVENMSAFRKAYYQRVFQPVERPSPPAPKRPHEQLHTQPLETWRKKLAYSEFSEEYSEDSEEWQNQSHSGSSGGIDVTGWSDEEILNEAWKRLDKDSAGEANETVKLRIDDNDEDLCAVIVDFEAQNAIHIMVDGQWLSTFFEENNFGKRLYMTPEVMVIENTPLIRYIHRI